RAPGRRRGISAGAVRALALGIKFSASLLAPVAVLLVAAEWYTARHDAEWRKQLGVCVAVAIVTLYVGTVLIWRGDVLLRGLVQGINEQLVHVARGHRDPAYLLGRTSMRGWWYFYP